VFHLRQLNLQFALVGSGALRKDIEDQACPIYHASVKGLFEIALLSGTEAMVNKNDLGAGVAQQLAQLLDLADTNQKTGIHLAQRCGKCTGYFGASRQGEGIEFQLLFRTREATDTDMNEHGPLPVTRAVKQGGTPFPA